MSKYKQHLLWVTIAVLLTCFLVVSIILTCTVNPNWYCAIIPTAIMGPIIMAGWAYLNELDIFDFFRELKEDSHA